MKKVIISFTILLFIFLSTFYIKSDFNKTPPTLYFNGNIITINSDLPIAEAMLVIEGKIESIGKLDDLDIENINHLQKKDLNGKTVLPGFIDVHTHFAISMFLSEMHDLSGFKHNNNKEVWNHFEEICKNVNDDKWLIFKGLDPILVHDLKTPTLQYLDSIAPNNPIVITSQSLHSYWANSKAFEKVGINKNTPNPSNHSYYERDSLGNFTGLIAEQEAFKPFTETLQAEVLTAQLMSEVSKKVMLNYAKNGNTTIVSTGLTIADSKPLILTEHLSAEHPTLLGGFLSKIGQFPTRQPMPRHFIYMRHDRSHLLPEARGEGNDFYDIIGIKHWYDGSPYIGSMYMEEPYLANELTTDKLDIPENSKGKALIDKQELKDFIIENHRNGWQIAIHTQGDAAIKDVVNAYQELDNELDFSQSRHRLEHCLMLPISELDKMRQLHLTPSFHINHIYYYGDALFNDMLGEERTNNLLPINSAIRNDLIVSLHADQPMFESLPFRLIQTALQRETKTGRVIGEEESIGLMDAIKALTINAAWQINMEEKIGSLEKGKYADFIILDKNPMEAPLEQLHLIECIETFINGNKVEF